jgi:5-methylthioadenosine/S-adenosylhomocysteine deaminase
MTMKFSALIRGVALAVLLLFAGACSYSPPDTRPDPELEIPGGDAGHEEPDVEPEEPEEPEETELTDPMGAPRLVELGTEGFLLCGTVLLQQEVLDPGEVLVLGERIECVASDCSSQIDGMSLTVIETDGVISPGLIDAHNHVTYNFLPPWIPSPFVHFGNRYQWMDNEQYRAHVAPFADNRSRGTHFCPAAKWGELRSLLHGTTTIQGQSQMQRCIDGMVRNADSTYHRLQHNHMRTTIDSPRDITDAQAQNFIDSFEAETNPTTRLAIHMAEGFAGNHVESEFDSFAGRDHRENRHQGISLLDWGTAMLIHSIALTPFQLEEVYMTHSMIVWSPSSNFALYDTTAAIEEILQADILTGLGPDWTVSGAFDMLEEMRVAWRYGQEEGIDLLTAERIWGMATWEGAIVVGLDEHIGRLEPGMVADIAIFGRNGEDPYHAVLESRAWDIDLVLIGGKAYFGHEALAAAGRNEYCEVFDACGQNTFVCAVESPDAPDRGDETIADIESQLLAILEGLPDAPEEQQYDRADDLLPLVLCDI